MSSVRSRLKRRNAKSFRRVERAASYAMAANDFANHMREFVAAIKSYQAGSAATVAALRQAFAAKA